METMTKHPKILANIAIPIVNKKILDIPLTQLSNIPNGLIY